jgi:hypothetical protein
MDKHSPGFAIAGFSLSLNSVAALIRKGSLTKEEAADLFAKSRAFTQRPDFFPDEGDALDLAYQVIEMAEKILWTELAQESPSESH